MSQAYRSIYPLAPSISDTHYRYILDLDLDLQSYIYAYKGRLNPLKLQRQSAYAFRLLTFNVEFYNVTQISYSMFLMLIFGIWFGTMVSCKFLQKSLSLHYHKKTLTLQDIFYRYQIYQCTHSALLLQLHKLQTNSLFLPNHLQ